MSFRALLRREVRRLVSGRVALFGCLAGLAYLSFASSTVVEAVVAGSRSAAERSTVIRTEGFELTNGVDGFLLLFAAVLGMTRITGDLRARTAIAILVLPISRRQYFVASWVAAAMLLAGLEACRSIPILLASAYWDGYVRISAVVGVLGIILGHCVYLALFQACSVMMPTAYAMLCACGVVVIGFKAFATGAMSRFQLAVDVVGNVVPLLEQQKPAVAAALRGSSTDPMALCELAGYRLLWTLTLVTIGALVFEWRDTATN